jgi:hypothetical protein
MCCTELPRLDRKAIDELTDRIACAAAHIDSATHELLVDIYQFDASGARRLVARQ